MGCGSSSEADGQAQPVSVADSGSGNNKPKPKPTPKPPNNGKPVAGYSPNGVGMYEKFVDFRENAQPLDDFTRPNAGPDDLYVDKEFPLDVAIEEARSVGLEWKRPGEFCSSPCLIADTTTRFDIGQGAAGTCYFLSMIALISERKDLFNRIIPKDAYSIGTSNYDGVFHCRFWQFGNWVDVYIDDFLPIIYDTKLWGARSSTDENEMWPALMEKAFSRFHGGYNESYGGQPANAFLALTGGVSEMIGFDRTEVNPQELHTRIRHSLTTGSIVACSVPDEFHKVSGLVGGHAYSLTGAFTVKDRSGDSVPLIRVRNPWGNGEWTGSWSDGSSEWKGVSSGEISHEKKDDGEFFISLTDFMRYFRSVTICSVTPDFDRDGSSDGLNFVSCMFGMWQKKEETAGGFDDRFANPKYMITIADKGSDEDGLVPVVVQILQRLKNRKDKKTAIRCDFLKVNAESKDGVEICVELGEESTGTLVFTPELQVTYRHKVSPGKYVVLPFTHQQGVEQEYLIRVYTTSPSPSDVKNVTSLNLMAGEAVPSFIADDRLYSSKYSKTYLGAWVSGKNAGGQVSHADTFGNNPQYTFTVSADDTAVALVLMQVTGHKDDRFALGIQLFNLTQEAPVDTRYLYENYDSAPKTTDGKQGAFIRGWDAVVKYVLPRGSYLALLHLDQPSMQAKYGLTVRSSVPLDISSFQIEQ